MTNTDILAEQPDVLLGTSTPDTELPRHADTLGVRPVFKLTRSFLEQLRACTLSTEALRLVLGLLHLTQIYIEGTPRGAERVHEVRMIERTAVLHRTIGPAAAKSTKALRKGVDGQVTSGLFRHLELPEGANAIQWAFSDEALDAMTDRAGRYGLVDIRSVRHLTRALPIWLHLEICLVRHMKRPRFWLDVAQVAQTIGQPGRPWDSLSASFWEDLRAACEYNSAAAAVGLERAGTGSRVGTLAIDVVHSATRWHVGTITKVNPSLLRLVLVTPKGIQRLRVDQITTAVFRPLLTCQMPPQPAA